MKLSNAQKAIKQAIEGGWGTIRISQVTRIDTDSALIDGKFYIHFFDRESDMFSFNYFQVLTDPLFWQALGKARGWQETPDLRKCEQCGLVNCHKKIIDGKAYRIYGGDSWFYFASIYFETRLNQQDESKFWESLP